MEQIKKMSGFDKIKSALAFKLNTILFVHKKISTMKTKCYLCITFSLLTGLFLQRANAQANTELSNLVSPTRINQHLLPNTDNIRNLGSANRSWKDLYLDGSVYLSGLRFLSYGNSYSNLFVGVNAGLNTTATANTAIGYFTLEANSTGTSNTANGYRALSFNTIGNYNTANGATALISNTTGSENTALGFSALYISKTLSNLVAVGDHSLFSLNGGSGHCTAVGSEAGYSNTTGGANTYLGFHAGNTVTTGSSNTMIGYGTDVSSGAFTNTTALGNLAVTTASNQVRIGNSSVTSIGGYAPWTNLSDGRFKKNVKENVPGLAFINQLHAVTYTLDVTNLRNFLGEDRQDETAAEGKMVHEKNPEAEALIQKGIKEKEKIIRTGFVAQEVEEAAKKIGYDFSGVDKPQNEQTPYGLRYSEFVVPLVKAVQELSKMNDEKETVIAELRSEIGDLKKIVLSLQQSFSVIQAPNSSSFFAVEQNIPNPFNRITTINYTLPQEYASAQLVIVDKSGKIVKRVALAGNGKGSFRMDASSIASGAYSYSLYVDGRLIGTKQMVLVK